jgi:pimeloyl-ACP methyl ester carboxylesterase
MERYAFQFISPNGQINGIYRHAGSATPLVVIANGHNGFYNYGMFPYIQQTLAANGISSVAFNYSHSGIVGENDFFEDLAKYGKNCRRLEKEDLLFVLEQIPTAFPNHSSLTILAHSMGGIATVFAAKEAAEKGILLSGAVLLNCLSTLAVRSEEVMEKWKRDRVWLIRNNRTLQDLPQGEEYLNETIASSGFGNWNPEPIVRSLQIPLFVAHGDADESVPAWHGERLFEWSSGNHPRTAFYSIKNGSHTLGTKHPFEGPNPVLDDFLQAAVKWIHNA